jgi:hypothetical protein
MFELPTTLTIDDEEFGIRDDGDYRMVLDCFDALQDTDLPKRERLVTAVVIFYDGFSLDNVFTYLDTEEKISEAIQKMFDFFNCGKEDMGNKSPYKLVDWEQDNHLIASAINNVAHTEVRSVEYMHWWTFMGHYISIGESVLSTIVTIRSKIVEGKKLEKHEIEFKRKNPGYFVWNRQTVEQQEADALIREIWNSQ